MKLSKKAQKLWDEFGVAYENHVDVSYDGTVDERREAASAYIKASKKLHNYVATLERKVASENTK